MKHKIIFWAMLITCAASLGIQQDQCFVPGECVDSDSIDILSLVDEYECLDHCKDFALCKWFTFFPSHNVCQLFKDCTSIDEEACSDCLSGEQGCNNPEPQCWIAGECEGNVIASKEAESGNECLRFCKGEDECKWFTFLQEEKLCFLFRDCETFDETHEGSISGERRCKEDAETTTISPTTTSVSPPIAHSKVLVALGFNGQHLEDVEIIDLLSSETTCQKPENFPFTNYHAVGGLGFNDKPLICGGGSYSSACHLYEDGTWTESLSLDRGRYFFAMTKSPYQNSKLFLAGGHDGSSHLKSSEMLMEDGWHPSIPMPYTLIDLCMTKVNSTSVMVIGGNQNSETSGRTFIFNSATNLWTEGPTMMQERETHSCGMIRKNSQTQEKSIIAAGGMKESFVALKSVEVLDLDSEAWRAGPDLPFKIYNAIMVEDPSGGVVLIGGYGDDRYLDNLYRLPHAGSDAFWEVMPQKLKTARYWHTAFLVPDEVAACN